MRYYKKLYIGNNIGENVLEDLKNGKPTDDVYAICVCNATVGMLEILSICELLKKHSQKRDYAVIALLCGGGSARLAVVDLFKSWLKVHNDLSGIKEYYNKNSV